MDSYDAHTMSEYWVAIKRLSDVHRTISAIIDDFNDTWCEDHTRFVGYDLGHSYEKDMETIRASIAALVGRMADQVNKRTREVEGAT